MFVGKRVGTGTEESKLVKKALGCSTGVLGSGGSWHSLIGDLAVSGRTRRAVWGREWGEGVISGDPFRRD